MSTRKAKRLAAAEAARSKPSTARTCWASSPAVAVITVFGAEIARVWKLGTLPRSRQITSEDERRAKPIEAVMTLRGGLRRQPHARELAVQHARLVHRRLRHHARRSRGRSASTAASARSRTSRSATATSTTSCPAASSASPPAAWRSAPRATKLDKYLAFPFGVGVALVLDESALLLELDDVYWTEEGVLSVQIAFAAIAMLSAMAYLIRMLRHARKPYSERTRSSPPRPGTTCR